MRFTIFYSIIHHSAVFTYEPAGDETSPILVAGTRKPSYQSSGHHGRREEFIKGVEKFEWPPISHLSLLGDTRDDSIQRHL